MQRIQDLLSHYIFYVLIVLSILVSLPVLYLLLYKFNISLPYIQISDLHKAILVNGELLILAILYRKYFIAYWKSAKTIYLIRDFVIVNCIFILPFILFYTNPLLQTAVPFLRESLPFIIDSYFALVGIAILLVFSTQKRINQINHWICNQIEIERFQDGRKEFERSKNFQTVLPRLSQMPFIKYIAYAVNKEGIFYVLCLLLLFSFGLVLRTWNLDSLPPYTDELSHILTARSLAQGLNYFNQVGYTRSFFIVTLPVAILIKLFGYSLWNARFVGVLVNLLAIFPIYLLGKRINKPIAILAVGLFVTSPWLIAVSRNVREYAYYPLFFYSTALIMARLYELVPDNFAFGKPIKVFVTRKYVFLVGFLFLLLVFVSFIDRYSTFKIILAYYPVFGILLIRKIDWRDKMNILIAVAMIVILSILIGILLINLGGEFISMRKSFNDYFILLFYEKPIQQWYYGRPFISILLTMLAILATSLWNRKSFVLPFTILVFGGSLITFSYLKILADRPRYAITLEFCFTLLIAVGLYVANSFVNRLLRGKYKTLSWLVILLLFWNVPHTFLPALYTTKGWHPITDEYHGDVAPSYKYLKAHFRAGETLVTTPYLDNSYQLLGGIDAGIIVHYNYKLPDAQSDIYHSIETFPSGWIALDYPRGYQWSQPVPLNDFNFAGKKVKYLDLIGDVFIFNWGENTIIR